jgi:hypothetical protein
MERASRALLFVSAQQNRFLRRRFAALPASPPAALTAAPPPVVEVSSSNGRGEKEQVMSMVQSFGTASDRVMAALVSGLEMEFGRGAGEALAKRFLEAEEVDFHWDARVQERWIGAYASVDEDDVELDRVAIVGRLDGRWFVAMMIVDGDGNAHGMMGKRIFRGRAQARQAFDTRR